MPQSIDANPETDKLLHKSVKMEGDVKAYTSDQAAYESLRFAFCTGWHVDTVHSTGSGLVFVKVALHKLSTSSNPQLEAAFEKEFGPNVYSVTLSEGSGPTEALAGCRAFYAYLEKTSLSGQYIYHSR